MKQQDYRTTITANLTPNEAFERISRVSDWWTKGVQGDARSIGDKFTVRFGDTFVNFEVAEVIPSKRAVWLVTDCNLHWIGNKTEWKNTKVVWGLSQENGETRVTMTHLGLVPEIECYRDCQAGWNFYVAESLSKLLSEGKGLPDGRSRQTGAQGRQR